MVTVVIMLIVRMIPTAMQSYAAVKQDTQIRVLRSHRIAQVLLDNGTMSREHYFISSFRSDSCNTKNGGCGRNTDCSHDSKTNAVVCTCKTGYTNTGDDTSLTCTGKALQKSNISFVVIYLLSRSR